MVLCDHTIIGDDLVRWSKKGFLQEVTTVFRYKAKRSWEW